MDIKNCTLKYQCTKTWDSLIKTDNAKIRYCEECDKGIHYCDTEDELFQAVTKGWCIATNLISTEKTSGEYVGEVAPSYSSDKKPTI